MRFYVAFIDFDISHVVARTKNMSFGGLFVFLFDFAAFCSLLVLLVACCLLLVVCSSVCWFHQNAPNPLSVRINVSVKRPVNQTLSGPQYSVATVNDLSMHAV